MFCWCVLSLAVKYGLNDVREGLSTIKERMLYGHALYRKFSCNVYYVSIDKAHFIVLCVFMCSLSVSVCCTLCVFNK